MWPEVLAPGICIAYYIVSLPAPLNLRRRFENFVKYDYLNYWCFG